MIGETLGPYRIESELGTGGMGKVYSCTVTGKAPGLEPGQRVALKIVHPHLLETPGFFKRFLREAEVGKQVQHDNVVRTYDADALAHEGTQHNFLVMEYVEGQTLRDLLTELERVPEELCRHVGREIAKGLAAIHAVDVVHRDMKPENVLITEDHVVKVMDLGVAQLQEEVVRLSQTGAFVGSIHYAAPEQFGKGASVDHRADLHALGLVLYEMATGKHPYFDEDFRVVLNKLLRDEPRRVAEINPQLSPFMEEVIHTLIAKDREERFATAEELAQVFDEGEKGEWWKTRAKELRIETKRPLRRIRIVRETALYGRDPELAKLRTLYDKVKEGVGRVLLVEGEAGIGKTRLIDEFVGRLVQQGEDVNFLFGSYPPGGAATAAGAFSTAFREHFGEEGLEETLAEYLTVTKGLIPAFAALLLGESRPKDEEPLTKDSLQTVFIHATRALAAERPTIVLIDDLHFAPLDGRALFAALAAAVGEHRILLVGSTRPGLEEDWFAEVQRLEHSAQLSVHRIGPKDLIELMKESFGSKRLADELGLQIAVKSDGNPFFAFEIIRGLREGEFITQTDDGTWVPTKVIEQIQIPSSVLDLIDARIADLSEEEKEILDVASCCGVEFDPGLVAEVAGLRRIPALRTFGRIEKSHRLIRSVGRGFVFDHNQIREALYEGQPPMLREEYHAAIAETIETREKAGDRDPKDLDGALCVDLCEHFFKGRQYEASLRYLDAALDHLEAGYLNEAAIALLGRVLAVPDLVTGERRIDLLLRKARLDDVVGDRDAEGKAIDEARALAEAAGSTALNARVGTPYGGLLSSTGRFDEAHDVYLVALQQARDAGDEALERAAARGLASVLWHQGRYDEAREHYGRNLARAREQGDLQLESDACASLVGVLHDQGLYDEARAHAERSIEISKELGGGKRAESATGNLGSVLWKLGRLAEARECMQEQHSIARDSGRRSSEGMALANLGHLHTTMGALDQSGEYLEEARPIFEQIHAPDWTAYVVHGQAEAAERAGRRDDAERLYADSLAQRRRMGIEGETAETLLALGRMFLLQDDMEQAKTKLDEALSISRRLNQLPVLVPAAAYSAALPGGDVATARDALESHATRLPPPVRLEAHYALWKATGGTDDLAEAHRLLEEMRDHTPEEYQTAILENVPIHREIVAAWKEHGG